MLRRDTEQLTTDPWVILSDSDTDSDSKVSKLLN